MFDLVIDRKLRWYDLVRIKIGALVSGDRFDQDQSRLKKIRRPLSYSFIPLGSFG